jgi:hypothetical protein
MNVTPNIPEDGHITPKHVVNVKTYGVSIPLNCVDGKNNKTLSYTQYGAEIQYTTDVTNGFSLTPPQETKRKKKFWEDLTAYFP